MVGCEGGASENWKAKGARAPTGGPTARSSRMHTDRQSTQLARRKTKRERERGMTAQESNIAVDTNGNRTSAEASPGNTEGSNQFDG